MLYFSQLHKGETLYCVDLSDLSKSIFPVTISYVEYVHETAMNFGCGCFGHENTWTLRFKINDKNIRNNEQTITVHHANTYYAYFNFNDLKNIDGRALVNKYHYLIASDKKALIKKLKTDISNEITDTKDKIKQYERLLDAERVHLEQLNKSSEIITEQYKYD